MNSYINTAPTPEQIEACFYCGHGWPVPEVGCNICGNGMGLPEPKGKPLVEVFDQDRQPEGENLKRIGIAKTEAVDPELTLTVRRAVLKAARTHREFTADAVYDALEEAGVIGPDFRVNLIGAAFNHCAKKNLIRWTGRTATSTRKGARSRLIRIWEKTDEAED